MYTSRMHTIQFAHTYFIIVHVWFAVCPPAKIWNLHVNKCMLISLKAKVSKTISFAGTCTTLISFTKYGSSNTKECSCLHCNRHRWQRLYKLQCTFVCIGILIPSSCPWGFSMIFQTVHWAIWFTRGMYCPFSGRWHHAFPCLLGQSVPRLHTVCCNSHLFKC